MNEEIEITSEETNRYTVGLEKPKQPKVFLDFAETNDLAKAKDLCIDNACNENREGIVWDRQTGAVVFRQEALEERSKEDVITPEPVRGKRGRRSKVA